MKKVALGVFMFFDLALIAASSFYLWGHLQIPRRTGTLMSMNTSGTTSTSVPVSSEPVKAIGGAISVTPATGGVPTRNIGFSYHNAHAKTVSIRADFTGWKAEPMTRGENGIWTYQSPLAPGEYAYCFTVDDKTFKDPANKRTKQIGRTLVSAIVVEARPQTPAVN